jgi:hypothetical protein
MKMRNFQRSMMNPTPTTMKRAPRRSLNRCKVGRPYEEARETYDQKQGKKKG